jgi:hypothetical protein
MTLRSMEELRQQAQGAQSLNIAFIGVVNGLFSALHQLQKADSQRLAQQAGMYVFTTRTGRSDCHESCPSPCLGKTWGYF